MTTVILNGADTPDDATARLCAAVEQALHQSAGGAARTFRTFHLAGYDIGHCLGEFDCWVKTPGRCRIPDEGQEIERAVHDADLLVLVTPVRFGAPGAQLKKAQDRLIPLISPFFQARSGLTHHAARYARLPRLAALGLAVPPAGAQAALFRALVESQALNMGSPAWGAEVVGPDPQHWPAAVARALATPEPPGNASGDRAGATQALQQVVRADAASGQVFGTRGSVVMLLASARASGTSTSESLVQHLAPMFQAGGAPVEVVAATDFVRDAATLQRAARTCGQADLLVVAAPLYVDSLPYLGLLALQHIAAWRQQACAPPARLVGVMNCGFPEAEQMRFALASLRAFGAESGYTWAGALAVGGGEAIHGRALAATGGMTRHLRHAINQAVPALLAGGLLPEAAVAEAHTPFIPAVIYRLFGGFGWRAKGRAQGLRPADLRARPFDFIADDTWQQMAAGGSVRARPLRVLARLPETAEALTLVLHDPAQHALAFEAGQALTLEAVLDGERVRRAYSVATAPFEQALAITVKRVPGGRMSNWIHDHLAEGDLVRCFGPAGHFTAGQPPRGQPRRLLLVAGGAGIVPLAAIARQVLHDEDQAQVTLVHGSASLDRMIYVAALNDLVVRHAPRLRLLRVLESPPPGWTEASGRLDRATLIRLLANVDLASQHRAMVCGPDAMRAAVRETLVSAGLPAERIVEESFVSPRRAEVPALPQEVTFFPAGQAVPQAFTVAAGHTLLEAALDAGIRIPFSCCSGGCGACRVRIEAAPGAVQLDQPNPVSPADLAEGRVPACLVRLAGPCRFTLA